MRAIFIILIGAFFSSAYADDKVSGASQNVANAKKFMASVLTEPDVAKSLVADDFEFVFMGRTRISNIPYDRDSYFSVWLGEVVPSLVPGGFRKLEVVDAMGDEHGVALVMEGDADGINGLYDNKYVFVFTFSNGKISNLNEYNSDLLVATRLYKQKLVAED
ncbi:MAG: hypothetical protein CMQ40_07350 [Gammaproteobacteria bacterium]|nr:hypothetical protein [Gammaproteobacteria bacterium]